MKSLSLLYQAGFITAVNQCTSNSKIKCILYEQDGPLCSIKAGFMSFTGNSLL